VEHLVELCGFAPGNCNSCRPAEVADDFRVRAYAIVRSWLRVDVEGLVALVGDNADELLPDFWLTLLTDLDRRPIHPG